jgi:hypothetical protein
MWDRRRFLTRAGLGLLGGTSLAWAQPPGPEDTLPDGSETRGMINERTERAVKRGLAYLNSRQQEGSFGTEALNRLNLQGNVAITSLAALAFMAGGNQPNRGQYGKVVTAALSYVLKQQNADGRNEGFLHTGNQRTHGPMYGHGFGTLFLGEVSGMVADPDLRKRTWTTLHKAVKLILRSQDQNRDGGWRYNPGDRDADISVTVCQIMALRSARNAGIDIPAENRQRYIDYVKRCQNPRDGWFKYQIDEASNPTQPFARTAAGVSALYSAGIYKGEEIDKGLNYLMRQIPGGGANRPEPLLYFYGHYYAAQVMWTARGQYWQRWFPAIRDELLALQNSDGSWTDPVSSHYGTAMACIILQIPNNYLPILQK